jgi:hypothetical protein
LRLYTLLFGDVSFNKNKQYKDKLTKVIIAPSSFKHIKKSLASLGVDNSTIFPDIDGLCKNLEYRFTKESS